MTTSFPAGTILGYPRIGRRRELKRAVEAFWAGRISEAELEETAATVRRATRSRLIECGLGAGDSSIPESFSFYDQVLDAAVAVGAVPERFADVAVDGEIPLAGYFTLARGDAERPPLEMTKWFDSNYHYLVPEIGPDTAFLLASDRLVSSFIEAKREGVLTRPVLVGPVTLLLLSKAASDAPDGFTPLSRLADLLPVYAELLGRLAEAGAEWVQFDEPALVSDSIEIAADERLGAVAAAYDLLGSLADRPAILVAAPYGSLGDALDVLAVQPIEAIALDLVKGEVSNDLSQQTLDGLKNKTLVAGVIDGHNIWRGDLDAAFGKAEALSGLAGGLAVSTSTSLLHVPHTLDDESRLGQVKEWLAFADEKVGQVAILARGITAGREAIASELAEAAEALAARSVAPGVRDGAVRRRASGLVASDFSRVDYASRRLVQDAALALPPLPTTTIGSFPQTVDIRRSRAAFLRGELSSADYRAAMRAEIAQVVELQERIGLDVLVHGEPERNDMVQYFAEQLDGFVTTENGWVQSYGSRCTRPSILWGDVARPAPMTVEWSRYAQSLTSKTMKGMLTGPVTILAWSFVRDDQPLGETARQVALALRDEITDLEAAGITVIQVDEPALRELLPLERARHADYLDWSVGSFRLATAGALPQTQIHTHLCYSEFGVVIDAIRALDADVTSIEAARSRMEVVADIESSGFDHGIGPGVYDIHAPRVPSVDEFVELIDRAREAIPESDLWINPDCGLKTRGYDETVESLTNMVEATERVRSRALIRA